MSVGRWVLWILLTAVILAIAGFILFVELSPHHYVYSSAGNVTSRVVARR